MVAVSANPLLAPWSDAPPFDAVKIEHFVPAFEHAMAVDMAEITAIADHGDAPTFENTIVALENAGRLLESVASIYYVWSSTLASPELQAIEREMEPRLAAFEDSITQNPKLFARIEAVYRDREKLGSEQQRLTWKKYTSFVRAGAKLGVAEKERVAAINQRLAALYTDFSQFVLADEEERATIFEHESDLDGLSDGVREAARAAATARGQNGKFAIENTRSAMEPFLTYATRRDLREKVWTEYVMRGDNGDAHDTKAIIVEVLALRAERAKLLGYPTHAHWRLENSMAKTPERAMELMEKVWKPAVARVREEVRDMREMTDHDIAPWDYRFYSEKVRKAKYDLDETQLTPYLQLEKLREAMFWVAGELFDFEFRPAALPVYHPDVRTWTVHDRNTNDLVGSWYFDPFARPGKRSGAWMNAYRSQERLAGKVTPIVSNNANFLKGRDGAPVLVSFTDATTLFHEFGHALHGLCSNVTYPALAGTRVPRDYVEFPSQLLEHWLATPEVLDRFALHHETGAPLPKALVAKLQNAKTFNQGFGTVEYLSAAFVDMKLHLAGDRPIDPTAFEKETLAALGMPSEIVMRHRTPQFSHIFSGDAYSAGYYSYLWADTLTADAFVAFEEKSGPYDRGVAASLRTHVFSVGDTLDPAEAYRAFRGRDVDTNALMKERGLA